MANINAWRGTVNLDWYLSKDTTQGVDIMIRLAPDTINVIRNNVKLPPQVVRVDYDGRRVPVTPQMGTAGSFNYSDIVVLGYHNHPTEPDLDLVRGDRFELRGRRYEVDEYFSIHQDRATYGAKETN